MMSATTQKAIEATLEKTALFIHDLPKKTVTLMLYSDTYDDFILFADRCGELWSYGKAEYNSFPRSEDTYGWFATEGDVVL